MKKVKVAVIDANNSLGNKTEEIQELEKEINVINAKLETFYSKTRSLNISTGRYQSRIPE